MVSYLALVGGGAALRYQLCRMLGTVELSQERVSANRKGSGSGIVKPECNSVQYADRINTDLWRAG